MTEKKRTPLGKWIVRQRYIHGLSQAELAEKAGVSTPTVINLETGKVTRVTPKTIRGLATAFDADAGMLFDLMEAAREEDEA